jgi:glutamate 5-kinase
MADIRRVVLKIGTSILLDEEKKISIEMAADYARQIKAIKDRSVDVIVVSSGAVACGMECIGLKRKPREMAKKQALASIGQIVLM